MVISINPLVRAWRVGGQWCVQPTLCLAQSWSQGTLLVAVIDNTLKPALSNASCQLVLKHTYLASSQRTDQGGTARAGKQTRVTISHRKK